MSTISSAHSAHTIPTGTPAERALRALTPRKYFVTAVDDETGRTVLAQEFTATGVPQAYEAAVGHLMFTMSIPAGTIRRGEIRITNIAEQQP
jgi:hypothetical protein